MLKLVWVSLVIATAPVPAEAGFIVAAISAAFSTISGWLAAGGITGFVANTAAALLASAVQMFVARRAAKQQDIFRELQEPTSLPVYRFVYGQGWAPGTPAPVRVKGRSIYACYILNSLPSQGPFTLYLDKREVQYTGDPFDFSGPGASGANGKFAPGSYGPHVRFWIGRGDQISPPQAFLNEASEHYQSSDGWRGRTVLWAVFRAGKDEEFNERWPSAPPEVIVDGKWTFVWDPRDATQSFDDPSTWKWSRNQALCVLHALIRNPVKPYPIEHLWIDSFKWAADVADTTFEVKEGEPINQFSADGVLSWAEGTEIEDQVAPLLAAGASRWVRAFGKLGILPATFTAPVGVISEVLSEQEMIYESLRSGDELYTEAYAEVTLPSRAYESGVCPTYIVPGAQDEDGTGPRPLKLDLPFVHDHRQGQHICKIEVMRTRMQKSATLVAPPESINYLSGANVQMGLPSPYSSRNGTYKIEMMTPGEDLLGLSGGVALRVPMTLREESPEIYAWDHQQEERDMEEVEFDPNLNDLSPPASLTVSTGAAVALVSGNSVFPRALFQFAKSSSARTSGYEWKVEKEKIVGAVTLWDEQASGTINQTEESPAVMEGYTGTLMEGARYRIGVRATSVSGSKSEYLYSSTFTASAGAALAPPPTPISATKVATGIQVRYRTPNVEGFASMEIYVSSTNNVNSASFLFGPLSPGRNVEVSQTQTGLSAGQTRYYWARSRDTRGFLSNFSSVLSATF